MQHRKPGDRKGAPRSAHYHEPVRVERSRDTSGYVRHLSLDLAWDERKPEMRPDRQSLSRRAGLLESCRCYSPSASHDTFVSDYDRKRHDRSWLGLLESGRSAWHIHRMDDEPDLSFCGLTLWVEDREFPEASDYWDGNWLIIRGTMKASGALVECGGPILTTADVERFRDDVAKMISTLAGEATLTGLEPGINMTLEMCGRGHVEGVIEITPDHLNQQHRFKVEADQSYLPALVSSCDAILSKFPVTNAPTR